MYRKKKKVEQGKKYIPPAWCKNMCTNSGNVACVYDCARNRDGRYFLPEDDLTLNDIAPFPLQEWNWNMSAKERQKIAGLYIAKLVEAVTGVPTDPDKAMIDNLDFETLMELAIENGDI